jgi:HK97 family phage major capsid protein
MKLIDILQEAKEHRTQALAIGARADSEGRELTADERREYSMHAAHVMDAEEKVRKMHAATGDSLHNQFGGNFAALLDFGKPRQGAAQRGQTQMSTEYNEAFLALVRSGGKQTYSALSEGFDPMFGGFALPSMGGMSAALYEGAGGGSTTAGGFAFSTPTDNQILPLGLPDLGVRSLARVIPTATDIKIPLQTSFGTAAIKAESGSSTNTFTESDPALGQFTLSAFMAGLTHTVSWEMMQDVTAFQQFVIADLINAVAIKEDGLFVSGSGTGQPQGVVGNVGTGTGSPYAVESTGAYLLDSTLDVVGTLKATYFPNAAWLMSRATATAIRRAQLQANLFAPVWTREGGRDFLHGYPVSYSGTMPSLPTATTAGVTPMLFGSFSDGYVIGDRGGSGTFVKILDQPLATSGQTVLLGYKRVDGRVRSSEAIQGISISHS